MVLTPTKPVPRSWFPESLKGVDLLGLASAGGQQGPLFAAAGARVTIFDNSPAQLDQDRLVAEREGLEIRLEQGDMCDLSRFDDASFDLVFQPCANSYIPDLAPLWKEAARVLRPGGRLLVGFLTPTYFIFDDAEADEGRMVVRYKLPFSELSDLSEEQRKRYVDKGEPLCFGHTMEQQIGGQLAQGLEMIGFLEDDMPGSPMDPYFPLTMATLSRKPTA